MRRGVVIGGKGAPSSERTALRGTDPVGVGVRELEGHDAPVPATCRGLSDALSERSGIHEAVGRVGDTTGLANNELVEVEAVVRNLKQRGAREGRTRGVDEARTVRVETLVVELDVVLYMGSIQPSARDSEHWGERRRTKSIKAPTFLWIVRYAPAANWALGESHGASGAWERMNWPWGSFWRSVCVKVVTHASAAPSPLFIASRSS